MGAACYIYAAIYDLQGVPEKKRIRFNTSAQLCNRYISQESRGFHQNVQKLIVNMKKHCLNTTIKYAFLFSNYIQLKNSDITKIKFETSKRHKMETTLNESNMHANQSLDQSLINSIVHLFLVLACPSNCLGLVSDVLLTTPCALKSVLN